MYPYSVRQNVLQKRREEQQRDEKRREEQWKYKKPPNSSSSVPHNLFTNLVADQLRPVKKPIEESVKQNKPLNVYPTWKNYEYDAFFSESDLEDDDEAEVLKFMASNSPPVEKTGLDNIYPY